MRALRRQARRQEVLDQIAAFKNVQEAPRVVRINAGHKKKPLIVTHESFGGRHYIGPLEDWKSIAAGDLPPPNRDAIKQQRYARALTIPSDAFAHEATLRLSQIPAKHLSTVVTELCLLPRRVVPEELINALGRRLFFNRALLSTRALGLAVELNSAPQDQIRLIKQLSNQLDSDAESLHTVWRLSRVVPRLALQPASRRLNEVLMKSLSSIAAPLRKRWADYFVDYGMVDGPYIAFWEQLYRTDPSVVERYRAQLPLRFDDAVAPTGDSIMLNSVEKDNISSRQSYDDVSTAAALVDEWALAVIPHTAELTCEDANALILRALGQEAPAPLKQPVVRPLLWQASPENYRRRLVEIPARQLCDIVYECTKDLAGLRPQGAMTQMGAVTRGRKKGLTPLRPRVGHGDRERARKYVLAVVETIAEKTTDFREIQACATISSLGRLVDEGLLLLDDEELLNALEGLTHQLVTTRNLENLRPIDVVRLCEGLGVLHSCLPYDVRPNLARFLVFLLRTVKDCPRSMLFRLLNVVRRMDMPAHRLHTILALRLLRLNLAPEQTRELAAPLVPHLPKALQKRLTLRLEA
eukprot:GEMP01031121.1.p1 GENE.GEMP01031121.1~~GEMP01031121.1.p1  ORF type:complete len:582 (+),score=109.52 GEMP01031121.1:164-1909(+)